MTTEPETTTALMLAIADIHSGNATEARAIIRALMEEAARICEVQHGGAQCAMALRSAAGLATDPLDAGCAS